MTTTNELTIQPYLFFDGRCAEAIEFYTSRLGAKLSMLTHFKESPDPAMCPAGSADKVMHATFSIGGTTMMASDGRCSGKPKFEGFSLSLTLSEEDEAKRLFNALAEGGVVQMPLAKTFYSPCFGMVADKFGVSWMVYVVPSNRPG